MAPTVHAAQLVRAAAFMTFLVDTSSARAAQAPAGASVPARPSSSINLKTGCIDRFDAGADYFPEKAVIGDAQGFSVTYHKTYKVLTVNKAYPGGPSERYVLLQCGAPKPSLARDLASAPIVPVPIKSMFSVSTTHLPLLVDLGRLEVLTGTSSFARITSPPVLARIQAGQVTEFGSRATMDVERIVLEQPDIVMTGGDLNASYVAVRTAGIAVVSNVEWMEATPLGRAEWVKFMALFLNEERHAASLFEEVRDRYQALVKRTESIAEKDKPRVMTGRGSQGQFYIAGGRSYVAGLIKDAGGRYVWADNADAGSPLIDLETQVRRAADADIWINGGGWKNTTAILAEEPRYREFKAYRTGQVWVYERRVNAAGANDYWSRAVTRPDLILADLIKIFHPELIPDHELQWYVQVPRP